MTRIYAVELSVLLFVFMLCQGSLGSHPSSAVADGLCIGRAAVSITPTEETGGVKPVLDELHAKAIVIQKDRTTTAIVVLDSAGRQSPRRGGRSPLRGRTYGDPCRTRHGVDDAHSYGP